VGPSIEYVIIELH